MGTTEWYISRFVAPHGFEILDFERKKMSLFNALKRPENASAPRVRHQRYYQETAWERKTGRDRVFTLARDAWARKWGHQALFWHLYLVTKRAPDEAKKMKKNPSYFFTKKNLSPKKNIRIISYCIFETSISMRY